MHAVTSFPDQVLRRMVRTAPVEAPLSREDIETAEMCKAFPIEGSEDAKAPATERVTVADCSMEIFRR